MKKIRKGCFETNSSSMHSICITKNDVHVTEKELDDHNYDSDECIYIHNGEWHIDSVSDGFGRHPFQVLTTFADKFRYALCEYCGYLYPDDPRWEDYEEMFHQIAYEVAGVTNLKIGYGDRESPLYLDANGHEVPYSKLILGYNVVTDEDEYYYKDENGVKHLAVKSESEAYYNPNIGMIDHQSAGLLQNFLKDKNISLKEFLSNQKYIIVIDGDEYCDFNRLLNSGIIDKDFIKEIYDKSGEDVEYLEWLKEQENEENQKKNI